MFTLTVVERTNCTARVVIQREDGKLVGLVVPTTSLVARAAAEARHKRARRG